jgi:hypothetical protein
VQAPPVTLTHLLILCMASHAVKRKNTKEV